MTRPSRAAAKRIAAQARLEAAKPVTIPEDHERFLAGFVPQHVSHETWSAIRHTHNDIMRRALIGGLASFKKRSTELAHFLACRLEDGLSIAVGDALTYTAIDDHCARNTGHLNANSRNDHRSRLRKIAAAVNPGLDAMPYASAPGHQAIKPPYTRREELVIKRVALRQRHPASRRQLCAVVGLCGGAGLDSIDLRELRACHIEDRGADGMTGRVQGTRQRVVVVRREYEDLVRVGLEGLSPNALIIGKKVGRRNIVGNIVAKAEIFGDVPHIEASRLRATWLSWLMQRPVPLNVILDAAGLKSARSIVELLPYVADTSDPSSLLRGEEPKR